MVQLQIHKISYLQRSPSGNLDLYVFLSSRANICTIQIQFSLQLHYVGHVGDNVEEIAYASYIN